MDLIAPEPPSGKGAVESLDAATGVMGSIGVTDYFVPHQGGLFAVDRKTGELLWHFRPENAEAEPGVNDRWGIGSATTIQGLANAAEQLAPFKTIMESYPKRCEPGGAPVELGPFSARRCSYEHTGAVVAGGLDLGTSVTIETLEDPSEMTADAIPNDVEMMDMSDLAGAPGEADRWPGPGRRATARAAPGIRPEAFTRRSPALADPLRTPCRSRRVRAAGRGKFALPPTGRPVVAAQKLQKRGMKMTDRIQNRMLSGTPVRRKSVYL